MKEFCFIGVDVSKHTLDIAEFNGELDLKNGHVQVENNDKGYAAFAKWLRKRNVEFADIRLCMEYTGLYATEFRRWLEEVDITYFMITPKKMHKFEIPENVHGLGHVKTDRMDAYKIAIYCFTYARMMTPSHLPSDAFFKLKRLIAERRQYVSQRAFYKLMKHDIGKYDTDDGLNRRKDISKILLSCIKGVDKEMQDVLDSDVELRRNYDLLTSIIGIGPVVAIMTIVLTENFKSIDNPRTYASYVAVSPFKKESGISVRRKSSTSSEGFMQAKADLSVAVLVAIQRDPGMASYWKRKKAEGKHSGVVLNAIKFKMIERMFAVVRRGTPYVKIDTFGK